jgi:NAD(P)-dependent dehydrogenase (short-subunit alcohol dehydrogenase family)
VFIVTGANAGLGFEASKEVARKGAKVIMACRSMDRAQVALTQISKEIPDASVEVMQLNLASLKSIHQFADKFKAKYDRLDVLLNNAGIMFLPERRETVDCISVAVDPGFVRTNWTRHQASGNRFNRFMAFLLGVGLRILGQSVEMGGLSLLRAAVDPKVKGGEYYHPGGRMNRGYPVRAESSKASRNENDSKKLWEVSEELTGVCYPLPVPVMA